MKISGLTTAGCKARQATLCQALVEQKLDAALLLEPYHVHYLTGHWTRMIITRGVLVFADGRTVLAKGFGPDDGLTADEVRPVELSKLATMIDDQPAAVIKVLLDAAKGVKRLGCDSVLRPWLLDGYDVMDLNETLFSMRRGKHKDEVALIKRCEAGAEAAYACAYHMIAPGVSEFEAFCQMRAAAAKAVGEPIGEFGNDFQSGQLGGPPRHRSAEDGELWIFDLTVPVRGYHCDVCRTFSVNRDPTDEQQAAHARVVEALEYVEKTVKPGVSCAQLYRDVKELLEDDEPWTFPHHLGHGIGLFAHERPRLNPNWDDTFQIGDTFTAEPGLYGDDLRAGIRLEENYLVTKKGVERLSCFPLDL